MGTTNYKEKIRVLRSDVEELQMEYTLEHMEGIPITDAAYEMEMESHMKMVQGPWQHLGVAIERMMYHAIRYLPGDDRDHSMDMTVDEACETAREMCKGFFDTWEKELDLLQYRHFYSLNKQLLDAKERQESKKPIP